MRQLIFLVLMFSLLGLSGPAQADKRLFPEPNNCAGRWQLWLATYQYTGDDRRNYYWLQRLEGTFLPRWQKFEGPIDADMHCEPIGFGNNDSFRVVGCTNNDYSGGEPGLFPEFFFCDHPSVTSAIMVPKRNCRANP